MLSFAHTAIKISLKIQKTVAFVLTNFFTFLSVSLTCYINPSIRNTRDSPTENPFKILEKSLKELFTILT